MEIVIKDNGIKTKFLVKDHMFLIKIKWFMDNFKMQSMMIVENLKDFMSKIIILTKLLNKKD